MNMLDIEAFFHWQRWQIDALKLSLLAVIPKILFHFFVNLVIWCSLNNKKSKPLLIQSANSKCNIFEATQNVIWGVKL